MDSTIHNNTYCRDWIKKVDNGNVSKIDMCMQSDVTEKEMDVTTFADVTSVSRNIPPEYRVPKKKIISRVQVP